MLVHYPRGGRHTGGWVAGVRCILLGAVDVVQNRAKSCGQRTANVVTKVKGLIFLASVVLSCFPLSFRMGRRAAPFRAVSCRFVLCRKML